MRTILLSVAVAALTTGCIAQERIKGNGNIVEHTRTVGAYTGIGVSNGLNVVIADRPSESITVVAHENLHDYIETEVKDGILKVKMKEGYAYRSNGKSPKVIVPNTGKIQSISASGGSDVYTEGVSLSGADLSVSLSGGSDFKGDVQVEKLKVACSGGSDFEGKVDVDRCEIALSGGSDMDVFGRANTCKAAISGGSDMDACNFEVKQFQFAASGGSDAKINCTEKLTVSASGGSDITYQGSCTVNQSIGRSSSLKKR